MFVAGVMLKCAQTYFSTHWREDGAECTVVLLHCQIDPNWLETEFTWKCFSFLFLERFLLLSRDFKWDWSWQEKRQILLDKLIMSLGVAWQLVGLGSHHWDGLISHAPWLLRHGARLAAPVFEYDFTHFDAALVSCNQKQPEMCCQSLNITISITKSLNQGQKLKKHDLLALPGSHFLCIFWLTSRDLCLRWMVGRSKASRFPASAAWTVPWTSWRNWIAWRKPRMLRPAVGMFFSFHFFNTNMVKVKSEIIQIDFFSPKETTDWLRYYISHQCFVASFGAPHYTCWNVQWQFWNPCFFCSPICSICLWRSAGQS